MKNPRAIRRAIARFRLRVLSVEALPSGETLLGFARKGSGSVSNSVGGRSWRNRRDAVVDGGTFMALYADGLLKEHSVAVGLGWIRPGAEA